MADNTNDTFTMPGAWTQPSAAAVRADHLALNQALAGLREGVDRSLEGLGNLGHEVYNLILQNQLEGKTTAYKKALVFDCFQTDSKISALSGGFSWREGKLVLQEKGMADIDQGFGTDGGSRMSSRTLNASAYAAWGSFHFRIHNTGATDADAAMEYSASFCGTAVRTGTFTVPKVAAGTTKDYWVSFHDPILLQKRNWFSISLTAASTDFRLINDGSSNLGGQFEFSSPSGPTGRMTTWAASLPASRGAMAWVRFRRGSVAFGLRSGGVEHPFTPLGTRDTVNLDGLECTEAAFRLDTPLPGGNTTVLLDAALDGEETSEIFDYGVMLL